MATLVWQERNKKLTLIKFKVVCHSFFKNYLKHICMYNILKKGFFRQFSILRSVSTHNLQSDLKKTRLME